MSATRQVMDTKPLNREDIPDSTKKMCIEHFVVLLHLQNKSCTWML
jgi:hypothetical protein